MQFILILSSNTSAKQLRASCVARVLLNTLHAFFVAITGHGQTSYVHTHVLLLETPNTTRIIESPLGAYGVMA